MSNRFLIRFVTLLGLLQLLSACGGSDGGDQPDAEPLYGEFRPADNNSAYKNHLVDCATIEQSADACRLSRLPFIGQATNSPTKANIMARVVVSHEWMASRFSELLDEMPDDIYQLFGGVTAIVIGADVRPSYYWAVTGAIYLDPADLWITSAERNTISKSPDYRSEFARELAFSARWRYVQGNDYAWDSYSLNSTVASRPLSAIVKPMAALLFHELAHANDFIPPALITTVNPQNTPLAQAIAFESDNISTSLASQSPLNSAMLYALAQVMFRGEKASDAQKMLDGEVVGLEFDADGASDTYAYASQAEDTAMLFEEVMMKYHFDVDRELAFTDAPMSALYECDELVVRWGKRNRVGETAIKARAEIVVQQLLDRNSVLTYFADLPDSTSLINGVDWCNNLAQFGNTNPGLQKMSRQPMRTDDLHQQRHAGHVHTLH